ncbi:MAG TPA: carboxypeptidase-like regulatory domain-containing protein [Acetobacteraceae bacterium]|jgi:hypothetical protein|nr:carboxypeptidase-like regulatory domain-containing protein [Acetobacteraceae bacterium]
MSENELRIRGRVTHSGKPDPIECAHVRIAAENDPDGRVDETSTDETGRFELRAPRIEGHYFVVCEAFGKSVAVRVNAQDARVEYDLLIDLPLDMRVSAFTYSETENRLEPAVHVAVGRRMVLRVETAVDDCISSYNWQERSEARMTHRGGREAELVFSRSGTTGITATITERRDVLPRAKAKSTIELLISEPEVSMVSGHIRVTMERTDSVPTLDEALWAAIHECSASIGFERYQHFIRRVFELDEQGPLPNQFSRRLTDLGARGVGAYRTLRDLTELFLVSRCGPAALGDRFDDNPLIAFANPERRRAREEIDERLRQYLHDGEFPYIERVVNAAYPWLDNDPRGFDHLIRRMFRQPLLIELWHEMCLEHGMMMRTMDAVCDRFENDLKPGENDALTGYELTPLWGLSDFFWDWISHEPTRLSPKRRIQEYEHEYGPTSLGQGIAGLRSADVRSAFPAAFTNLLNLCEVFYKEDNQTTVIADAFPALVGLREVHRILAMGAGNAAPQLTFAARVETLMTQLTLAQPELADFLRTRKMVPYDEAWMGQVDAMKDLQGWGQPSISNYRDLAVYGERILLSIRLGDWTVGDEDNARNWLRHHRNAIKRFNFARNAIADGNGMAAAITERPAARIALPGDGRQAMLRGRPQQAAPRLDAPQAPLRYAPGAPTRSRQFE